MPEQMKKIYIPSEANQWKTYSLADFATIAQGYTFSKAYQGKDDGRWQYFKVADIGLESNGKYLRKAINSINDETMQLIGCKPFPKGSIVFPRVGAALLNNNKRILAQDSVVDDNVLVLSITNRDICNDEYLYYALQQIRLDSWSNSSLVPVISSTTVLKQKILLPTIAEQRRIAEILSTQDRVIELYDRKIEQLKRFKKGALSRLFPKPGCNTPEVRFPGFTESWGKYAVRDIASESYSGGTPATGNDTYWNGSIPWIQSSDLTDGKLFYVRSRKHISKEALSDSATQLIPKDSIAIVTRVGVGKLALMPYAYTTSQDFLSLSSLRIEPVFAVYSLYHILQRESSSLQGTSIMGLTKDALLSKLILIPTKQSEQRMIGDYFKNLDYIITLHQRKRDEEIRKKKALMQLLLTGKVRV